MNDIRVAFVMATWHDDLVGRTKEGFLTRMTELGCSADSVEVHQLPGALEFPLHCKKLAQSGRYDAIACAALVVDGGIYRHEFVAHAVLQGMMNVMLETEVPIISAVLTPQAFHEHQVHHDFFYDHLLVKGREAADAVVNTITNLRAI
jgi:6,7-dimethyl-8-ribityllumazine synthase